MTTPFAQRVKRNAHIPKRRPKRESFRTFWRSLDHNHPAFRGRHRLFRRWLARIWYQESKA